MLDPSEYQNDERPAFMEEQGLSYAVISPDPEGGLDDYIARILLPGLYGAKR